ncbi:rho GTPase-activating protein 12-like isoform X2 [Myxocyprinus asiaticus]|uniref:rho GTPase-activating protein 12-like isoform X2 n=1 Tax=Myxocyprinus asiaticus TaxID=70543 RepID=UPI00222178D0|nr:rho GTPase-activating protein 12-like isoform X2 [Myxocyprinus asiaticus]
MTDHPVAPGQTYVEVEYDYEYKSKDRLITIKQGERYLMVKKTNDDWWQVRKDEGSKPFYVPAQYVREVRRALMPPPKPLPHTGAVARGGTGTIRPSALDIQRSDEKKILSLSPSTGQSIALLPPRDDRGSPGSPMGHVPHTQINTPHGSLPQLRAESPNRTGDVEMDKDIESEKWERGPEKGAIQEELAREGGVLDKKRNDSESGEELSSSTDNLQSVSAGQGMPESSVYTNLQELKISHSFAPPLPSSSPLHTSGNWETHKDQNSRHFYYNRSTQERTWNPPRTRDSLSRKEEKQEMTDTESNHSPLLPGGEDSHKTCSLDRRLPDPIPISRTRHSTYSPESNDKSKKKSTKDRRIFPPRRKGTARSHPYRPQDSTKTGSADSDSSCPSSPKPPHSPSEKCGNLNMTKITEHGKKVRKNWTSFWTVLQGSSLLFNKSQGSGTGWFGRDQKLEFSVDLKGGSVEWASKDKSSKKHVLELKTRQAMELLLQSDSDGVINEWHKALSEAINTHAWESDEAIEEDMSESPDTEKHDKEKEHRDSKKGRAMKNSVSMDNSDQKTKTKLKKFLTRRPTLQAVKDKGYIKDVVFGSSLSSLCQRENSTVPHFVWMCIEHVEKNGLRVDGLYRVSGNLAIIQKLRFAVNHDEKVDLGDSKWDDIHVTTGALKMFFRELPEPLFTYAFFNNFISAIKMPDYKQKVQAVMDIMKQLPLPNHDTIQVLFKHLKKVIQHVNENRMTTQSVAIVFGPTLLRPETETANMAVHMVYQNQIVELVLMEYEIIFGR